MARVLFHMFHTASHYNASFKLAKELTDYGHDIAFYVEDGYKENLMMNGFRYIDVPEIYHPNVEPVNGRMQFYVQLCFVR